jgi:hypothetical protein
VKPGPRQGDGTDGESTHIGGTTFIKTDFAKTDDKTFLSGLMSTTRLRISGASVFSKLLLNVLAGPGRGAGAQDALHGLHKSLPI